MSEMVERAVRAFCIASGVDPNGVLHPQGKGKYTPMWHMHVEPMRAAIAAMRNPTKGMLEAALSNYGSNAYHRSEIEEDWQAMIDAALRE